MKQKTIASSRVGSKKSTSESQQRLGEKTQKKGVVTVIGLGYVGLPLALLAEQKGYELYGIDHDERKVADLRRRNVSYLTPKESRELKKSRIHVSQNDVRYVRDADIIIICVPTPVYEDHLPNLEPLKAACEFVGAHLRPNQLIIIESTVNPGVCEEIALPILEERSGLSAGTDFFFAHCPERINPGDSTWNVRTIPRVIGANDSESLERATNFYRSILEGEVKPMNSIREAEAVKIVENSFRDINIAFVNELAMSFDTLGIDIKNVLEGASTKPFAFMAHQPGCGVGGHCIPVDPYYLISYAAKNGFTHRFLSIARDINNSMPRYTVETLSELLEKDPETPPIEGSTVALLGVSYKRDVPDVRESPASVIHDELVTRGVTVRTYDPLLPEYSNVTSLTEALQDADAAIIATDHSEFRSLRPENFLEEGVRVVVDGRNCLPKEEFLKAGIHYKGIGR